MPVLASPAPLPIRCADGDNRDVVTDVRPYTEKPWFPLIGKGAGRETIEEGVRWIFHSHGTGSPLGMRIQDKPEAGFRNHTG